MQQDQLQQTLMSQGIELMIFGMGTVFLFLTVLVVLTIAMSAIVRKISPEKPPVAAPVNASPQDSSIEETQLVAVITAAIKAHRDSNK